MNCKNKRIDCKKKLKYQESFNLKKEKNHILQNLESIHEARETKVNESRSILNYQSDHEFNKFFPLFAFSPDRNNPVQGVWRQEQRCSLWCDHLRGLQRLLQAVPVVGRQLSMSAEQELRGRPCKQKPVPVLSVAKVPTPRHV